MSLVNHITRLRNVKVVLHKFVQRSVKPNHHLLTTKTNRTQIKQILLLSSYARISRIKTLTFAKFLQFLARGSLLSFFQLLLLLLPKACKFIKSLLNKRLWQRCFPVNFAKFLRGSFLQNTSGQLLLCIGQVFMKIFFQCGH